jgi:phage tail sheath protein FI
MPTQLKYPGVYIEEISSGVRTITGVATSITAFIGRALRGPVNDPTMINSFGDYERIFGGLWADSTMSFAVRDFYLNGGSQAIIVRIGQGVITAAFDLVTNSTSPPNAMLRLLASSGGAWASALRLTVDYDTQDPTVSKLSPPAPDPSLFNLVVYENGDRVEQYLRVSLDATKPRYLPRLLETNGSRLQVEKDSMGAFIVPAGLNVRPAATVVGTLTAPTISGDDGGVPGTGDYRGANDKSGLNALKQTDLFNLLCIPPPTRGGDTASVVYQDALALCVAKRAMLLVDPPAAWGASSVNAVSNAINGLGELGLNGVIARNAAIYYPRIRQVDPDRDGHVDTFVPCGVVAGVMAQTDSTRGVWKSPAGIDAGLNGVQGLQVNLTDEENGLLNPLGINCLRTFPVTGRVIWGARTLRGADQLADEYKYLAVRRTALFIEESLFRGTKWVVFEPNDEPLWAQIRLNVGAFMHNLFRQGAFQGRTPREAYLVKCDKETTRQNDINLGVVNILVGFAPLKPAEFVIIKLQQLAGQVEI